MDCQTRALERRLTTEEAVSSTGGAKKNRRRCGFRIMRFVPCILFLPLWQSVVAQFPEAAPNLQQLQVETPSFAFCTLLAEFVGDTYRPVCLVIEDDDGGDRV